MGVGGEEGVAGGTTTSGKLKRCDLGRCVFSCALRMVEREKVFPHKRHGKGRSPVWTRA